MLHLLSLFLLVLLMPSFAVAASGHVYTQICEPCKPHSSLLWRLFASPFSSSICLLTTFGFFMLFISPYTRVLATSLLDILDKFVSGIFTTAYRLLNAIYTHQEMEAMKKTYEAQLREKDCEMKQLELQLAWEKDHRTASDDEVNILSTHLLSAEAKLEDMQERLDNILASDAQREIASLEIDVSLKDRELADHASTSTDLQSELSRVKANLDVTTTKSQKLRGDYQDLKAAHRKELADLKQELETKQQQHDKALGALRTQFGPYQRTIEILRQLSEGEGDQLTVAVAFARILQANGVDLGALGINQQRVAVLWDFVLAGQSAYAAVQPQRVERGFRLRKE